MFAGRGAATAAPRGEVVRRRTERTVEAALEADRRRALRAQRGAAQRSGDVSREDLDAVAERGSRRSCGTPLGALVRVDGEVGTSGIADEQRVAREDEPWLVARERSTTAKQQCSGRWPGVCRTRRATSPSSIVAVRERLVREGRPARSGRGSGRRARARAGRDPRRGRHACASRGRRRARGRAGPPPRGRLDAKGGSTTTALPTCSSPTRYDAQPRSSSRNCLNTTETRRYHGSPLVFLKY